jgi:hypothetical protein
VTFCSALLAPAATVNRELSRREGEGEVEVDKRGGVA